MKKSLLVIAILQLLLVASCSSGPDLAEPLKTKKEKTSKVTVSVLGETESHQTLEDGPPLKNLINQLTVICYKGGIEYTRKTQLNTDPSFGKFDLDLPYANIVFVAIGSKTPFGINQFFQGNSINPILSPLKDANCQYWQDSQFMGQTVYKTNDTFFTSELNTIFDGNLNITLGLKRIVGKLEIDITDVNKYNVEIYNEAAGFKFQDGTSFGSVGLHHYKDNNTGKVSFLILRTHAPLGVEISGGGKVRTFQVPIFKNQRTIIKGKLLEPLAITDLKVSVDSKWSADSVVVPL